MSQKHLNYQDAPHKPVERHLMRLAKQVEVALLGDFEGKRGLFGRTGSPGLEGMLAEYPETRAFAHEMSDQLMQLYEARRSSPHHRLQTKRQLRIGLIKSFILTILEVVPESKLKRNKSEICNYVAQALEHVFFNAASGYPIPIQVAAQVVLESPLIRPTKLKNGDLGFSEGTIMDYFTKPEIHALVEQSRTPLKK